MAIWQQTYDKLKQPPNIAPVQAGTIPAVKAPEPEYNVSGISTTTSLTSGQQMNLQGLIDRLGKTPQTPAEQISYLRAAGVSDEQMKAMGIDVGQIVQNASDFEAAKTGFEGATPPTTTGLNYLQQALLKKADINKSQVEGAMKSAGIEGFGALPSVLTSKSNELQAKIDTLRNTLTTQGTKEADVYNAALNKYTIMKDAYDASTKNLAKIVDDITSFERQLQLYEAQRKIDIELENLSPSRSQLLSENQAGVVWTGDKFVDTDSLEGVFTLSGQSNYRENGWECAEGSNRITDGLSKPGDSWQSKMNTVTHRDTPMVGNGVAIPAEAVGGDPGTGHYGTVISFDPSANTFTTVEWNHNGDGRQGFYTYNIDEMNANFGDNWGFGDQTLKPEYQEKLDAVGGDASKPGTLSYFLKIAREESIEAAKKKINEQTSGKATERMLKKFDMAIEKMGPIIMPEQASTVPYAGEILSKMIPETGTQGPSIAKADKLKRLSSSQNLATIADYFKDSGITGDDNRANTIMEFAKDSFGLDISLAEARVVLESIKKAGLL